MFEHILPNEIQITKAHPVLPEYLKEELEIYPQFKLLKTRDERYNYIKKYINNLVSSLNDPNLIEKACFYKMYSDGSVKKKEKHERSKYVDYEIINPSSFFSFPLKGKRVGDTYAIMTYENCLKVRYFMDQLLLKT
jgi:hypothetical protein